LGFEIAQVGAWILAEATTLCAVVSAFVESLTETLEGGAVGFVQVSGGVLFLACGRSGDDSRGAAQDQCGRGDFSASGPTFVIPMAAKELLQCVIGARQVADFVTVEQS
jgi:hypothetical protein